MKVKRILAVVLAALMLLTIVPAAAFAVTDPAPGETEAEVTKSEAEPKPEKVKEEITSLGDHLYTNGTNLPLTNYIPGFTEQESTTDGSTYRWIESNNYGQANSEAMLTIDSFYMYSGETITFQYWYETESGYDTFKFMDNNSQVFSKSGSSSGWESYTYTCTSSGLHEFDFIYHKDGSNDTGADCVRIAYLTYSRQKDFYLTRAALNQGMSGNIINVQTTGTYPFYVKETTNTGHELYLYNGNKGANNSTSTMTVKAWVEMAPIDFTFDYAISCEPTYDYFKFSVNGTEEFRTSGSNDYSWKSHTYTCEENGLYTFTFAYTKDSSINQGEDVVCIDNLRFAMQDAGGRAGDYNYVWGDESNLNSASSDAFLTFNSPKGTTSFVGTNNSGGNDYRIINNNRYVNNSDSYIETIVNMAAGERLSFQYYVSSEDGYDALRFDVNGDTEMVASGWWQSSWQTFTSTAPATGSYVMRWQYHKDGSDSEGYDYAMIDTVRYYGSHSYGNATDGWGYHNAFTVEDALIDASNNGGSVRPYSDVLDGNEYFLPYNDGSGNCLISRNKYYEDTSAYADVYCDSMVPGDQIRFEYTVRSESADKLRITLDANGSSNDVNQLISGNSSDTWHTFTWTCQYAEDIVVHFEFSKDYSVNTEPDCCMLRNFAVISAPNASLDNAMNASGNDMHFTSGGTYKWESGYLGSDLCGMPTNRGNLTGGSGSNCTATVSTTLYMDFGSTFSFQYKADLNNSSYSDWTPSFTCTVTHYDTSNVLNLNNSANVTGWTTKTYEAFTSGFYTFTWTYTRPERGWEFDPTDVVAVRNCDYAPDAGVEWPGIDEALNVEGGTIHFENNRFWSDYWYNDDIVTSSTWGEPDTNGTLTTSIQMNAGDKLRFQYFVSSEQDYDYLVFRVNGSNVFTASGLVEWEWYEWTAPSAGTYSFEWTYHKDGSLNRGMDCAKLDYVEHISAGTPSAGNGDVDGNGTVNVTDAIMALRHAMGVITLNAAQIARGDVDGNGVVNVTDAVRIMRIAMGIG